MITKQCLDIVYKAQIKNSKELKTHALRNYNKTEWARRLLSVLPRSFRYCELSQGSSSLCEGLAFWAAFIFTLPHLFWSGSQIKPIPFVLHPLFFLVWGKQSEQGQVETWVAVEYGSLTKEKGQPGPGALKATDPTYFYMPQSNLPNIWVRQAGFKPIIRLLFYCKW